jgi:predicted RNA-binding protein associated with RNAse of E/G family
MQVLRNCNVGGKPRYSLPAIPVGTSNGYHLYYRPEAEVIHHTKGKSWNLPAPELMLVPQNGQHVVSMSLTPEHVPLDCYVNINLQPTPYSKGMEWQDLELDLKLTRADHGWYLALLDVDEYDQANLSASLRASTEAEIARIIDAIQEGRFPFRCVGSWHQILKDFPSRSL